MPQGAVTSPFLSNIICSKLDLRLQKYCSKRDVSYSRYADDLVFSGNNRDELKKIHYMVDKIVCEEGFEINRKKTQFLTPKKRKRITGITLANEKLKAPKEMKRKVRSMIHRCIVTGNYGNLDIIRGYIAYINSIESDYKSKIVKYISKFYNDPITMFDDAVNSFNSNKIFSELPDMIMHSSKDFIDFSDWQYIEQYESDVYSQREDFMDKFLSPNIN